MTTRIDYRRQTAQSRTGRLASNDALAEVEEALAAPGTGREREWLDRVVPALDHLLDTLSHQASADQADASLLSEIARNEPRFGARIHRLHQEQEDIRLAAGSLRTQLEPAGDDIDVADVRDRLAAIARRYRQHRAREADLVYEAVNVDLGSGD